MPPLNQLTKEWLRLVLKGEKKFLAQSEIKPCDPGHWPEVAVKHLYDDFSKRPEVEPYMPPKVHKGRTLDKKYCFEVWNTIFPAEIDAILKHANEQRHSLESEHQRDSAILVSQEMSDLLFKYPWISR